MDPLSQVLELLDLHAASPSRLEAAGRWALSFPGHQHLKIGAVVAGQCWLIPDQAAPQHLAAGDCYLLVSRRPYTAASDDPAGHGVPPNPVSASTVLPSPWPTPAYYQTTPDDPGRTILISGSLSFDDTAAALLLDRLPPVGRIAAGSPQASVVAPALQLLAAETGGTAPGSDLMRQQLTCILFIQVLRALLETGQATGEPPGDASGPASPGWLAALRDPQIGAALTLIHQEPARRWTVVELAAAAGLSRSSFALHFRTLVGLPPLDYLVRWRMQLAARALRSTDRTVAAIGASLGYSSESAFSNAFKRVRGQPPSRYRRA
ncbi:MAG TPA: AraC family transcriptional regulator [Streptosporangiaceae bacterium]|jgi:AraC-like DNA-binding protein